MGSSQLALDAYSSAIALDPTDQVQSPPISNPHLRPISERLPAHQLIAISRDLPRSQVARANLNKLPVGPPYKVRSRPDLA